MSMQAVAVQEWVSPSHSYRCRPLLFRSGSAPPTHVDAGRRCSGVGQPLPLMSMQAAVVIPIPTHSPASNCSFHSSAYCDFVVVALGWLCVLYVHSTFDGAIVTSISCVSEISGVADMPAGAANESWRWRRTRETDSGREGRLRPCDLRSWSARHGRWSRG